MEKGKESKTIHKCSLQNPKAKLTLFKSQEIEKEKKMEKSFTFQFN